jgi:hypothetical protein
MRRRGEGPVKDWRGLRGGRGVSVDAATGPQHDREHRGRGHDQQDDPEVGEEVEHGDIVADDPKRAFSAA